MSTDATTGRSRFTDSDKIKVVEWILSRPIAQEFDTLASAAKAISEELQVRLAPAVLANILQASTTCASKLTIGSTAGPIADLKAVVDSLSLRIEAAVLVVDELRTLVDALSVKVNDNAIMQSVLSQKVDDFLAKQCLYELPVPTATQSGLPGLDA